MHRTRIADYVFLTSLRTRQLDNMLSQGYFRNAGIMFQSPVICLDGKLDDIINIRLDLLEHTYPKSIKKIARRVESRFRVEVSNVQITSEVEKLFHAHRKRFKGYQFQSLQNLLYGDNQESVFDSKMIAIYDGNRLIAYSIFDLGWDSIASIVGVFSDEYSKYSLGIYTMYAEVKWAKIKQFRYYYPGYIMRKSHLFDYKMRLGEVETLDWETNTWKSPSEKGDVITASQRFLTKLEHIKVILSKLDIPYEVRIYPFYSLAYFTPYNLNNYVSTPIHILLPKFSDSTQSVIIEYDIESDNYSLSTVSVSDINEEFVKIENQDLEKISEYECKSILEYVLIKKCLDVNFLEKTFRKYSLL